MVIAELAFNSEFFENLDNFLAEERSLLLVNEIYFLG